MAEKSLLPNNEKSLLFEIDPTFFKKTKCLKTIPCEMFDNDGIIIITSSRSQFIKTGAWGKVLNSQDKKKKNWTREEK